MIARDLAILLATLPEGTVISSIGCYTGRNVIHLHGDVGHKFIREQPVCLVSPWAPDADPRMAELGYESRALEGQDPRHPEIVYRAADCRIVPRLPSVAAEVPAAAEGSASTTEPR